MLTTAGGRAQISSTFQLCEPLTMASPAEDVMNFWSTIIGSFMGVVQYNRDNRAFEGAANVDVTVDTVCDMMVKGDDAVAAYASVSNLLNLEVADKVRAQFQEGYLGDHSAVAGCVDVSYKNLVTLMTNTSLDSMAAEGGRQWVYQTCAEFGYYQTTDGAFPQQVFGPSTEMPLSFSEKQCADFFGPVFTPSVISANVNASLNHYGGKQLGGTNILIPNGSIDPWHALSVTTDTPARPTQHVVFIVGTAHCANMYPPAPTDLPSLTNARKVITQQLGEWLQSS
eukprot:Plantae.Rhodophyta-Rhodochaete_pulchella.ctg4383.p1 GENE.Plantae.Rhodophyta-Rhodochaete_pulchella.ctg4383~~Plantae.Rhodophyta-Rhodochaete_pulchella.ctg4383.p1  ORF type:complete len:332 (-),score=37.44 Plantae.Rhodophyta-Rhodochaete_pulchella.ctg4383:168-1016(-)